MPLNLFYTMVQKSQNDQKLKSRGGGPALSWSSVRIFLVVNTVFSLYFSESRRHGLPYNCGLTLWSNRNTRRRRRKCRLQKKT